MTMNSISVNNLLESRGIHLIEEGELFLDQPALSGGDWVDGGGCVVGGFDSGGAESKALGEDVAVGSDIGRVGYEGVGEVSVKHGVVLEEVGTVAEAKTDGEQLADGCVGLGGHVVEDVFENDVGLAASADSLGEADEVHDGVDLGVLQNLVHLLVGLVDVVDGTAVVSLADALGVDGWHADDQQRDHENGELGVSTELHSNFDYV